MARFNQIAGAEASTGRDTAASARGAQRAVAAARADRLFARVSPFAHSTDCNTYREAKGIAAPARGRRHP
jgi:hypothetical protein